jgi:hypothetical protein
VRVYILFNMVDWDIDEIVGVYSSKRRAIAKRDEVLKEDKRPHHPDYSNYRIEEWEVED